MYGSRTQQGIFFLPFDYPRSSSAQCVCRPAVGLLSLGSAVAFAVSAASSQPQRTNVQERARSEIKLPGWTLSLSVTAPEPEKPMTMPLSSSSSWSVRYQLLRFVPRKIRSLFS